jgi:hypothetical protein
MNPLSSRGAAPRASSAVFVLAALVATLASCLKVDFDPASVVSSVRILAAGADKPYAKPGDSVELEVLAYDGRADRSRTMTIYWIPIPCINPPRDLYFLCFSQFGASGASGANGGGGGGGTASALPLQPGTDLTPLLPTGPKFSFKMPEDAIAAHPPTPGATAPYGLAIVFNVACAGRVKIEAPGDNPQSVPLGCYDDAGNKLGPSEYVIGFTRVYAYDAITNANPALGDVTFEGVPVGPDGIVVDHCVEAQFEACQTKKIGVVVPDDASEPNPLSKDASGHPQREQVWAAYYGTLGRFDSEIRLLFDASQGRVPDPDNRFKIPREPGTGTLWVVVRDNRGGATWRDVKITVR